MYLRVVPEGEMKELESATCQMYIVPCTLVIQKNLVYTCFFFKANGKRPASKVANGRRDSDDESKRNVGTNKTLA